MGPLSLTPTLRQAAVDYRLMQPVGSSQLLDDMQGSGSEIAAVTLHLLSGRIGQSLLLYHRP